MKRKILLVITLSLTFILTSCGMAPEEIETALTDLNRAYESGTYDQAEQEIEKLDKSYKKMSDEQKTKFDELKSSVEYAASSITAINEGLNNAQSLYDQKMYYEAYQELEKLAMEYTLPPTEQKQFDEKKIAVDEGIENWKITSTFQQIEELYNGGDYDSANNELSALDVSTLSEDQNKTYQTWQNKIDSIKTLVQAESYYNNGSYTSASNTLSKIDTTYLTSEQNQKYGSLKEKIANAIEEASKKVKNVQTAIDLARQYRERDGEAAFDNHLGNVYSGEEYTEYYLVKVRATRNADGESRYKVYKSTGAVEYIGSGSEWIGD